MKKTQEEILLEQAQLLVQHRKELDGILDELSDIKIHNKNADLELMKLPIPDINAKDRSTRDNLVDFMRKVSWRDGQEHINLWRKLYKEFKIRYNVDLKSESKKYNMSKIMYAEKFDYVKPLYALACKIFGE